MGSFFSNANLLFLGLTAVAMAANVAALALPTRSIASIAVGFGAAALTFVIAGLLGSFLYLLPAVVIAVLAAREWSYRWCLVSVPAVAVAYFLFDLLLPVRWPFLLLTLVAYVIPFAAQVRRRRRAARPA